MRFQANKTVNIMKSGFCLSELWVALTEFNIPLKGEDCLGSKGRTILFNCADGILIVKKIGQDMKKL